MQIPLSLTKILKLEFEKLLLSKKWLTLLLDGQFYEFEKRLHTAFGSLYDVLCEHLITFISETAEFRVAQKTLANDLGLRQLIERSATVQLRTGTKVKYRSLYAKKKSKDNEGGSRHLSHQLWNVSKSSGSMYKSLSCLLSVLCPSFELSKNLLRYMGIDANYDRVRSLSLTLSEECMKDRPASQLSAEESVKDKQVLIGIDGGRTRTRVVKDKQEDQKDKRKQSFDTPWREPKVFVITTIDQNGKLNKESLPIYDCSFGDVQTVSLLGAYLKKLKIWEASNVQIVGDGAPWIWNKVPALLLKLGVARSNIIETLDYYHASEHVYQLKAYIDKGQQYQLFKQLKQALWEGSIEQIRALLQKGISGVNLDSFTPYQYFERNKNRIDYQSLRADKRPCGSGVIESGIRRIINLRFKGPSSFWYPENVEKLILMRSIALSGRWNIMMQNLNVNKN